MKINGEQVILGEKKTLKTYLIENNYEITKIAVELDGDIASKSTYDHVMLYEDSILEIVRFVGGG
jgi:thiamine biosynthesis protein ThiS